MVEGSHDLRWTRPPLLKPDGTQSNSSAFILMPHPAVSVVLCLSRGVISCC